MTSEYDELYNPANLLAVIKELQERVQRLELQDVSADALSELADDLGDVYGGTVIINEYPMTIAPDISMDVALSIDPATLLVTCAPSGGQRVPLLDINQAFTTYYLASAITYDASALTKDKYIDWYIYVTVVGGALTLALYPSVWTNDTTRSEAQATYNGVVVLASDITKRFVTIGRILTSGDPWVGGDGDVSWGGLVNGATPGHVAVFADATGKIILDGGVYGIPAGGATTQLLQWSAAGAAKWVTISGAASIADGGALTVANDAITNAKLANMAANTIKANATTGSADPADLALTVNTFPARSSSGNIAAKPITDFGLSLIDDATAADARATLGAGVVNTIGVTTANGVSATSSGGADPRLTVTLGAITPTTVNGVRILADANLIDLYTTGGTNYVAFDVTNNKLVFVNSSNQKFLSIDGIANGKTLSLIAANDYALTVPATGTVMLALAVSVDNRVVRYNGTAGQVQSSGVTIDDANNMTGVDHAQVNYLNIATSATPSSSSGTGAAGDICWDSNYLYVCVATNTWKRVAIATW